MCFKLVLMLGLIAEVARLEETNDSEFSIVSTQRPPQNTLNDDRLTKLEEKLEHCTKVRETNHRLENLELQNLHTEVTNNRHKLEAIEVDNKQIQIKLQNIHSVLTNIAKKITESSETFPRNCKEIKDRGQNTSDIYRIKPDLSSESFFVLCNMDTRGGGWTYFLNRFDGSQDFYLNWTDYKNGFGNLGRESWLGLDHLYQLTGNEVNELLIELVDHDEKKVSAHYCAFSIGNESERYKLNLLGRYSGDAGDSFSNHIGMNFSTGDKDHLGCAIKYTGAWWYTKCYESQLTGQYLKIPEFGKGMNWGHFHGYNYSLKQARMMIKPKDYKSPAFVPHQINS